jgi:hypothetical protein
MKKLGKGFGKEEVQKGSKFRKEGKKERRGGVQHGGIDGQVRKEGKKFPFSSLSLSPRLSLPVLAPGWALSIGLTPDSFFLLSSSFCPPLPPLLPPLFFLPSSLFLFSLSPPLPLLSIFFFFSLFPLPFRSFH